MNQILGGAWSGFNAVTIMSVILIILTTILALIFAFVPSVKNKTVTMHTWGLIVLIGSLLTTPLLVTGLYYRDAIKNTNHPHLQKGWTSRLNPFGRGKVNNRSEAAWNQDDTSLV